MQPHHARLKRGPRATEVDDRLRYIGALFFIFTHGSKILLHANDLVAHGFERVCHEISID